MTAALEARLHEALAGSPLAARLAGAAAPLLEHRSGDAAAAQLAGPALLGLARAVATQAAFAGFLPRRPQRFERIAGADAETVGRRALELAALEGQEPSGGLEG